MVLSAAVPLLGVTGQLVIIGTGIKVIDEIQKTPERFKKNKLPRTTNL